MSIQDKEIEKRLEKYTNEQLKLIGMNLKRQCDEMFCIALFDDVELQKRMNNTQKFLDILRNYYKKRLTTISK